MLLDKIHSDLFEALIMLLRQMSVLTVFILSLSLGGVVTGVPAPQFPPLWTQQSQTGDSGGGGQLFQQLNLTPEQAQTLQAIQQEYQGQISQHRNLLRQAQQELETLMAGDATEAELRAKHQQVKTLMQQMGDLQFESLLKMREVLTLQQRRLIIELMEERKEQNRRN